VAPLQVTPQAPQFCASFATQAPPQKRWPTGHEQVPSTHANFAPLHALPQVPQFAGSSFTSTQLSPQTVCLHFVGSKAPQRVGGSTAQVPLAQREGNGHEVGKPSCSVHAAPRALRGTHSPTRRSASVMVQ
jgi:hypothetical protein